jgi:outer membrane lipoprotein-sorting protein
MRNRTLALAALLVALSCFSAKAQTADELIKKNIQARGGIEKVKALKSVKASATITQGGLEIPLVLQQKRPSSFRVEITFQGKTQIQAYDGVNGWKIDPFQGSSDPEKMTDDELKEAQEQADLDGSLVDYKEKGHTVELMGKEDVEGTPAYKLKVTLKNGDIRYIYLDAANSLEIKITSKRKTPGGEIEIDSYPGNYKEVSGVIFPFSIENKTGGQTIYTITISKVETDVPIDDAIFKMPTKGPDKPKAEH